MEICKRKLLNVVLIFFFILGAENFSHANQNFEQIENKKVSFLDFFIMKFESTINQRAQILRKQLFATRVQYSNIGIQVNLDKKNEKILINIHAVMDRNRYKKKKYIQKLSDCNQVRNLIFYQKHGYKFITQKRDPYLSHNLMKEIFKEAFFKNLSLNEKEIQFLTDRSFVKVTILHPIKKSELSCHGKVNDYELQ